MNIDKDTSLVLQLFENKMVTLSQAAKMADVSVAEFLEFLKGTDIDVVDYPAEEVEQDLENIL